jgi:hypothetical protein
LPNFHGIEIVIKPEGLVINPELLAIIGVEAAHVLESLQGALHVERDTDFLGPFTLDCLIERFAIFDATAGEFRHIGGAALGCKHDGVVIDGDDQSKYAAAWLDDGLCIGGYNVAASVIEND